jgi:Domain of unknown function (DUF4352)
VYDQTVVRPPRRRGRLIAIIAGLAFLAVCVAGATASWVGAALREAGAGATQAQSTPTFNQPVRDGKFEFVVSALTCGHPELTNGFLRSEPQGQFCVVDLHVTNIGAEARRFADGSQKAYGPDGAQYAADTGAGVVANGNGNAIWNVINPGNSVAAKVVFDIPPTATIVTLELHDSPLSAGVKVSVSAP